MDLKTAETFRGYAQGKGKVWEGLVDICESHRIISPVWNEGCGYEREPGSDG